MAVSCFLPVVAVCLAKFRVQRFNVYFRSLSDAGWWGLLWIRVAVKYMKVRFVLAHQQVLENYQEPIVQKVLGRLTHPDHLCPVQSMDNPLFDLSQTGVGLRVQPLVPPDRLVQTMRNPEKIRMIWIDEDVHFNAGDHGGHHQDQRSTLPIPGFTVMSRDQSTGVIPSTQAVQ